MTPVTMFLWRSHEHLGSTMILPGYCTTLGLRTLDELELWSAFQKYHTYESPQQPGGISPPVPYVSILPSIL